MNIRIKLSIILFILCFFTSSAAYAHSGRTDAAGGHWDNASGEYHFHHGYPEHYHINGICPYTSPPPFMGNFISNAFPIQLPKNSVSKHIALLQ